MTPRAVAAVPSAPLLLPAMSPAQPAQVADAVAALRRDVERALAALPSGPGGIVLVASTAGLPPPGPHGSDPVVLDASAATMAGYGRPDVRAELPPDRGLADTVRERIGATSGGVDGGTLHGDLAVLALLVAAVRPDTALVALAVPAAAAASDLSRMAAGLAGVPAAADGPVAILAAGDLAATLTTASPGYLVEGADRFDDAAVEAVRGRDLERLAALGPVDAARVQARGWAPLVVATAVAEATGVGFADVRYHAPRGVGQLVAVPVT